MKRGAPMKRTALLRHTPLASTSVKPREPRQPKPRKCAGPNCEATFIPRRMEHIVCSPRCLIAKRKADEKAEREHTRERKQAVKTLRQLLADAQVAFNAYIRARDAGRPCICCGKPFEPQKPGGAMDAGHYLGRSIAPQHRFNENNVFGQRKNCNRPGGTTRAAFRAGVIERIGLAAVEELEADNRIPKWTREELIALKAAYRKKLRELNQTRSSNG